MDAIVQLFVNESIGETRDANPANRVFEECETIRLFFNRLFRGAEGMQEIARQLGPLAGKMFCDGGKFNIGFAVQNDGFHSMAA
jgi:hypothetical protein